MIVRAFYKEQVQQFGSIEQMMEKYPIGGIFVPYWDFLYTPPREQVIPTIKSAIADYENASKYPMIVTEDFERGDIPMSRLDEAVERIWGVREQYGLLKKKENIFYAISDDENTSIKKDAQTIADNAVTLLTDKAKIPLKPSENKRIAIVNISHENRSNDLQFTQKLLQEKGFDADTIIHNPNFLDWGMKLDFFDKYDKIIVAFENRYFNPLGASLLKDKEALGVWTMGMLPQDKIIAISYSNPYYVKFYFENAYIGINAYSLDQFSQKAVVNALTGSIPFRGTSPVKLEHDILK